MKEQLYKQCVLSRQTDKGQIRDTAWIPAQFAKVGKHLIIKEVDGWIVESVGASRTVEDLDRQRTCQKRFESVLK